jgi:hypothetical protein
MTRDGCGRRSMSAELLTETEKMRRVPGIAFTDSATGRR